jgi:hypothetical protein
MKSNKFSDYSKRISDARKEYEELLLELPYQLNRVGCKLNTFNEHQGLSTNTIRYWIKNPSAVPPYKLDHIIDFFSTFEEAKR